MDRQELNNLVIEQLITIAPELEDETLVENEDMRDAFDLDSMDFLNLVTLISKKTKVSIPESDYTKVLSIQGMVDYVHNKMN